MTARRFLLVSGLALVLGGAAPTAGAHEPLAHTYSIVARDASTGEMGVAVQSHWFSVGSIVSWGRAGVGVVATQSFVNPAYGPQALALLEQGLDPTQALGALLANDAGRDVRQVAVLDAQGRVAVHTGAKCIPAAGHQVGDGYAVQANLMANDRVWPAMARAFETTPGPLAERLVAALAAAQAAGGDIRGQQSAALLVVRGAATGKDWEDRAIDLRIADHPEPVRELERLLRVHRAYEKMNEGDLHLEHGDMPAALAAYAAAEALFPDNEEMKYWHAVTLVNNGRLDEALPLFRAVFAQNADWKALTPRLVPIELLHVDDEQLRRILGD